MSGTPYFLRLPYQWDGVKFLTAAILDGEQSLALTAPTGCGKSVMLIALYLRVKHFVTGCVIATPAILIEGGFNEDWDIRVGLDPDVGSSSSISYEALAADTFIVGRDENDKPDEFANVLRPGRHTKEVFLTTHHQLVFWGTDALPDRLDYKLLIIDEAHRTGFSDDAESKKESTQIAAFALEWQARGGIVLRTTATPFRADGLTVHPEGTIEYVWSLASHAASKYAPDNFDIKTVIAHDVHADTVAQLTGDDLSERAANERGYQAMVDRWVTDGKPKSVFILPGKKAKKWVVGLCEALRKADPSVRVLNAVGVGKDKQGALVATLAHEKQVIRFADSRVDVIVACKRFDEGTDWPLCSHVYCWGIPRSFGLTIQRWGRTFRYKGGIAGYPAEHAQNAKIVFFVPTVSPEVLADFEQQHHHYATLLACYMANYKTAQKYGYELRIRMEGFWARRPKPKDPTVDDLTRIRVSQALEVQDHVRTAVLGRIVSFEAAFEQASGRKPNVGELQDYLLSCDLPADEALAAGIVVVEHLAATDPTILEDVAERFTRLPLVTIRPEMLALFRAVADERRDRTLTLADAVTTILSEFTAQEASEVALRLAAFADKPNLTIEIIREAGERFREKTGRWPLATDRDATEYFGFNENWVAVAGVLKSGGRGLPKGWTLPRVFDTIKSDLTIDMIREAGEKFKAKNGRYPTQRDGAATEYFGFEESWSAVHAALIAGGRGLSRKSSLSEIFNLYKPDLTISMVKSAGEKFKAKNGRYPLKTDGDATEYFGFNETWVAVSGCARKGTRGYPEGWSLPRVFGTIKPDLTVEMVKEAGEKFKTKNGRYPLKTDGDATEYFGFNETWSAVSNCVVGGMRGLPGGISLARLFGKIKPDLTIEMVKEAGEKFKTKNGRYPSQYDGDVSEYFGFNETCASVNNALRVGLRGLPGGSTMAKCFAEAQMNAK